MEKPLRLELRLDWSEMDLFGHINNVMFFKYIQASRVNYWEYTGLTDQYAVSKIGPILASSACRFIKPLYYPGNIVIEVEVEFVKNSSFGLKHRLLNEKGELVAEAQDVIVWFDFNKHEKVMLSEELRKLISASTGNLS